MFTYNPNLINDAALNQMRFELGDCIEGENFLCDEEISAALSKRTFKRAKLFLVESLLARFSYDLTKLEIHEAKFDLSGRVAAWRKLRDDLKEELEETDVSPSFGFSGRTYPEPYFTRNLHDF